MSIKREIRKIERAPAERARLRKQRGELSTSRPSLRSLIESGKYDVVKQGDYTRLNRE